MLSCLIGTFHRIKTVQDRTAFGQCARLIWAWSCPYSPTQWCCPSWILDIQADYPKALVGSSKFKSGCHWPSKVNDQEQDEPFDGLLIIFCLEGIRDSIWHSGSWMIACKDKDSLVAKIIEALVCLNYWKTWGLKINSMQSSGSNRFILSGLCQAAVYEKKTSKDALLHSTHPSGVFHTRGNTCTNSRDSKLPISMGESEIAPFSCSTGSASSQCTSELCPHARAKCTSGCLRNELILWSFHSNKGPTRHRYAN